MLHAPRARFHLLGCRSIKPRRTVPAVLLTFRGNQLSDQEPVRSARGIIAVAAVVLSVMRAAAIEPAFLNMASLNQLVYVMRAFCGYEPELRRRDRGRTNSLFKVRCSSGQRPRRGSRTKLSETLG